MAKPVKYTKSITLKISETQKQTLEKLSSRNIRVSNFIREAIREKIEREASDLKPKKIKEYCPFG